MSIIQPLLPYLLGLLFSAGLSWAFLGVFLAPVAVAPEPELKTNYTNGDYMTFWAEVYQRNAALKDEPFVTFMNDPQRKLHLKVLRLPTVDLDSIEDLLPAQKVAAEANWLFHVERSAIEEARVKLNFSEYQELIARIQEDGITRYQF